MTEKPSFVPDNRETAPNLTPEMLEGEMREKRVELAVALTHAQELGALLGVAHKSGDEAAIGVAWKAWTEAKNVYAKLVETVSEYEREHGKRIVVPDGSYRVEVKFMHYKRKEPVIKTERLLGDMQGATLKDLIFNGYGAMSMLGVHNFGFHPEEKAQDECQYTLQGPDGFAYRSSVLIDRGGQIIRRASDVR